MKVVDAARRLVEAVRQHPWLLRALTVLAGIAVVVACVLAVHSEWGKAGPKLADANPVDLVISLAITAGYYLVFILGWIRILAAWKIKIPYRAALQSEMVSMLAKYIPGGVWTPAARVAALQKLTGVHATATILASILVEAVLSAISGVVVFVVSLAWVHGVDAPLIPLVAFALLCAALLHPRVFRPVAHKLLKPFGVEALDPLPFPTMVALLAYYCGTWLVGGFGLFFLVRALGDHPGLSTVPFLGGVSAVGAIVAVVVVFAPSGLGVREASMYGLLIAIASTSAALGAVVLNRLAITVVELALFAVGLLLVRFRPTPTHPQQE